MITHTPPPYSRTLRIELDELPVAGRLLSATFVVDVVYQPAQQYGASLCYYDTPPDGPETTIKAVSLVEWSEFDSNGDEVARSLTQQQVVAAAMDILEQRVEL